MGCLTLQYINNMESSSDLTHKKPYIYTEQSSSLDILPNSVICTVQIIHLNSADSSMMHTLMHYEHPGVQLRYLETSGSWYWTLMSRLMAGTLSLSCPKTKQNSLRKWAFPQPAAGDRLQDEAITKFRFLDQSQSLNWNKVKGFYYINLYRPSQANDGLGFSSSGIYSF